MSSLRTVHLVFILLAIIGADMFGAWSVWYYAQFGDPLILTLGIVSIIGGFGLIFYVWRLVRGLDAARIT